MSVFYDLVSAEELEDAAGIEARGYPEDEAGSLETFRYRQAHAPELFLGAFLPGPDGTGRTLIGYVCATCSPDGELTPESMETHVPGSPSICIHSVCVDQAHRRKRVGFDLLKEFVAQAELAAAEGAGYERILLITHDELHDFYTQAGFEYVGLSLVVHGARPWSEMRKELRGADHAPAPAPPSEPTQEVPAGLWEALQRSSTRARPAVRLLTSFPNAVKDVVSNIDGDSVGGVPENTYDLLCPRSGCGSVILKSGVASWVERESVQLDLPGQNLPECLGVLPVPPATAQWWLVKPNPMAFENIGFSRAVQTTGPGGGRLKFLACAECDLGPLGWCEEGGSEFWLACNRVGYLA